MATRQYLGVDGDWNNTSNWSGGFVPVNGDAVIFSDTAMNLDTNLNQSTITLASLHFGLGYAGSIGALGNTLRIDATEVFFDSGGDETWLDGTYPDVLVNGGLSGDNMLQLDGDIDELKAIGGLGTITLGATAVLDNLTVAGDQAGGLTIVIPSGVTSLDDLDIQTGEVICGALIAGTLRMMGGTITMTDDLPGATVAKLDVLGGVVKYNSSGTCTALNIFEGELTIEDNIATSVEFTNVFLYEAGVFNLRNTLKNFVLPGGIRFRGAGQVIPPLGATMSIA